MKKSNNSVKFKDEVVVSSKMEKKEKPRFRNKLLQDIILESMKYPDIHPYFKCRHLENQSKFDAALHPNFATILDIDPDFYSILKSDWIKQNASAKDCAAESKKCSILLLKAGYVNDELLKIKQNFKLEKQMFDTLCRHHNKFVDDFEEFLAENYDGSMQMLKKSVTKGLHLEEKQNSCRNLNTQLMTLKSKIYVLGEKFNFATTYQKFLYQISPLTLHSSDTFQHDGGKVPCIQDKSVKQPESSLMTLISTLKTELSEAKEPQLYFKEPSELKKLFASIEMQNLTCWTNAERLTESCGEVRFNVDTAIDKIHNEFDDIGELIESMTTTIKWEEARVCELKQKIIAIINDILRNVICSEEVVKLDICVQDIYDKLIFKDLSFETIALMETLENEYEANMIKLDYVNLESTKFTQRQCYKDDITIMKTAQEAAKKLKRLETLSRHLKKTLTQRTFA